MRSRATEALLAAAVLLSGGCAVATATTEAWSAEPHVRQALSALSSEDFETARGELLELASRCEAGARGRNAILLLAAAELDAGNPKRSPREAAHLAESYLLLPDASEEGLVLARAMYRVAADLGGLAETREGGDSSRVRAALAPRFDRCGTGAPAEAPRPLPTAPAQTLAARLWALDRALASAADSLTALGEEAEASRARIVALEAEIQRITALLTSAAPPAGPREPR